MCKGAQMCSEILLKCISFNLGLQCSFFIIFIAPSTDKACHRFSEFMSWYIHMYSVDTSKMYGPGASSHPAVGPHWPIYPIPHTPKSRGWVLQRHQTDPKPDRRLSSKAVETRINRTTSNPIQWNLPVTTTSIIKFNTCNLFSNVF